MARTPKRVLFPQEATEFPHDVDEEVVVDGDEIEAESSVSQAVAARAADRGNGTYTRRVTKSEPKELSEYRINKHTQIIHIIGRTPLYCNTMAAKAWRELLYPSGRKTWADKAQNQKHDPHKEYGDSMYVFENEKSPTYIGIRSDCFKRLMEDSCTRVPGCNVDHVRQTVAVTDGHGEMTEPAVGAYSEDDTLVAVYGIPFLKCDIIRQKGVPDVRTRGFLPRWCCRIRVTYPTSLVDLTQIAKLMADGGLHAGVGDWRMEKGGYFGSFLMVNEDDDDYLSIMEEGRAAQQEAIENLMPYDRRTSELLSWFVDELGSRKAKQAAKQADKNAKEAEKLEKAKRADAKIDKFIKEQARTRRTNR